MENKRNKIGFIVFIIILIIVGVGGFVAMKYFTSSKEEQESFFAMPAKETDYRLDKSKDFIYYDTEEVILEKLNVGYKKIYINLASGKSTAERLNAEALELKKSIKYIKDVEIPEKTEYEENEEGIYSLDYREYVEYDYEDYITILAKDSSYNVIEGSVPKDIKAYVFNKKEDKLLTETEILTKYNATLDAIKEKIKIKLNAEQETVDEEPLYNINETLDNFKYSLAINKIGRLEINYIIRSTKTDFYDNIIFE